MNSRACLPAQLATFNSFPLPSALALSELEDEWSSIAAGGLEIVAKLMGWGLVRSPPMFPLLFFFLGCAELCHGYTGVTASHPECSEYYVIILAKFYGYGVKVCKNLVSSTRVFVPADCNTQFTGKVGTTSPGGAAPCCCFRSFHGKAIAKLNSKVISQFN